MLAISLPMQPVTTISIAIRIFRRTFATPRERWCRQLRTGVRASWSRRIAACTRHARSKQVAEGLLCLYLGVFDPLRVVPFENAEPGRKCGKQKRQGVLANELSPVSKRSRAN